MSSLGANCVIFLTSDYCYALIDFLYAKLEESNGNIDLIESRKEIIKEFINANKNNFRETDKRVYERVNDLFNSCVRHAVDTYNANKQPTNDN